jgi:tRNA (guanine37-N1)-methyltransferase
MFDAVATHPAVSIPAARTSELRRVLEPLLYTTATAPSRPGNGSDDGNSGNKSKKKRGRGQPCIVKQEDEEVDRSSSTGGGGESSSVKRKAERRLLVLRLDYDTVDEDVRDRAADKARRALSELLESHPRPLRAGPAEGSGGPPAHEQAEADAIYLATHDVRTDYSSLSASQVLRRLLMDGRATRAKSGATTMDSKAGEDEEGDATAEVPARFETAGHVAHVNLKDEWLPYKYWIGKVLLDKNAPAIRTVVNKVGSIENEYRVLDCEVIAGDDSPAWSLVTVKEEGCAFELDFRKVYWNSRLAGEHHRLVRMIREQARSWGGSDGPLIVADLMAGVGPFAVPLSCPGSSTQRGKDSAAAAARPASVVVHANDLNPDSYRFLVRNGLSNQCRDLHCYNLDARDFVIKVVEPSGAHAVIMNLPASAPEFLDAFRGYGSFCNAPDDATRLPVMYVYCFAPKDDEAAGYPSALERCRRALACECIADATVRTVRNVSPRNNMVCAQFRLPREVRGVARVQLLAGQPTTASHSNSALQQIDAREESASEINETAEQILQPAPKRSKTSE